VNGVDFRGISHQQAVSVLKRCGSTADIVCQYVPEGTAVISITFLKSYYFVTVLDVFFMLCGKGTLRVKNRFY